MRDLPDYLLVEEQFARWAAWKGVDETDETFDQFCEWVDNGGDE